MQKYVAFRNMEHSAVLEEFAYKHLEKVEKVLENEPTPVKIDLVITAASTHPHHNVEIRVKTPHYDLITQHEGPELYQEIDKVTDKMVQEIRKAKEKRIDELKRRDSIKSA